MRVILVHVRSVIRAGPLLLLQRCASRHVTSERWEKANVNHCRLADAAGVCAQAAIIWSAQCAGLNLVYMTDEVRLLLGSNATNTAGITTLKYAAFEMLPEPDDTDECAAHHNVARLKEHSCTGEWHGGAPRRFAGIR